MSNTGFKIYTNLELYFLDNGSSTGVTKPNTIGDPNYVPPVFDPVFCPLPSPSPSASPSPSLTPTPTPSVTPTITSTPSITPSVSVTPSVTASPNATPSVTPTITPTPSVTPSVSMTPSVTPSVTPSSSPIPNLYDCRDYLLQNNNSFDISWTGYICGTTTIVGGNIPSFGGRASTGCIVVGSLNVTGPYTQLASPNC